MINGNRNINMLRGIFDGNTPVAPMRRYLVRALILASFLALLLVPLNFSLSVPVTSATSLDMAVAGDEGAGPVANDEEDDGGEDDDGEDDGGEPPTITITATNGTPGGGTGGGSPTPTHTPIPSTTDGGDEGATPTPTPIPDTTVEGLGSGSGESDTFFNVVKDEPSVPETDSGGGPVVEEVAPAASEGGVTATPEPVGVAEVPPTPVATDSIGAEDSSSTGSPGALGLLIGLALAALAGLVLLLLALAKRRRDAQRAAQP